jgi:hypothetical protein
VAQASQSDREILKNVAFQIREIIHIHFGVSIESVILLDENAIKITDDEESDWVYSLTYTSLFL